MSITMFNPFVKQKRMTRLNVDSSWERTSDVPRSQDPPLLTLGGLTVEQTTRVRVLQTDGVAPAVACQQLLSGSYDKPFLVEDGKHRAMCFSIDGSYQSEMRIDEPDTLVNEYTRKMMAFLLFCPQPSHVLMIGLGGGSLLKYCYRNLPDTQLTAVEIDSNVIALRSLFAIPDDDTHLRIVHADGASHVSSVAAAGERVDVLLVDAYDRRGIAPAVAAPEFIDNAARVLSQRGVFVMNLAAYESECTTHLRMIRAVFGEPVIPVSVGWGGNTVVFAGPALRDRRRLAEAPRRAERLQRTHDLNFHRLPDLVRTYLRHRPAADSGTTTG